MGQEDRLDNVAREVFSILIFIAHPDSPPLFEIALGVAMEEDTKLNLIISAGSGVLEPWGELLLCCLACKDLFVQGNVVYLREGLRWSGAGREGTFEVLRLLFLGLPSPSGNSERS